MTVFAFGNSIGDVVTNLSIARMGYPTMALGACLGGPMLYMVLGLGLSSLLMHLKHATISFHIMPEIWVIGVGLAFGLALLILLTTIAGYRLLKPIGVVLVTYYVLLMAVNGVLYFLNHQEE